VPDLRSLLATVRARLAPTDLYAGVGELRRVAFDQNTRISRLERLMATDRDTLAAIVTGLQSLAPAINSLSADRDQWRSRALSAEGAA
jgi:hypothetical protein